MSHHHDEEDSEIIDLGSMNHPTSRRSHSHGHIHLNPTAVFDHIKTKVKRKRSSNHGHAEIPIVALNGQPLGRQSFTNRQDPEQKKPLAMTYSQPLVGSPKLSDHSDGSLEDKGPGENRLSIEKEELNSVFSDSHEKDEETASQTVQWRLQPLESDDDNNNNSSRTSKFKSNKPVNTKKRRTLSRRTVQSSSKLDTNKTKKGTDNAHAEALPYLTSFQIRDEDFQNIFKDLPSDEQLISSYPCVWRKETVTHGRLFLTTNHLYFYARFVKREESLSLDYKDIISVTREKSTKLILNAIQIRTKSREQYLFASYIPRERIYIALFRLWQNALLEKPLDYQQLKAIVFADQLNLDESTGDSDESVGKGDHDEQQPQPNPPSNMLPVLQEKPSRIASPDLNHQTDNKHRASLSLETPTYLSSCPCDTHLAKTYAEKSFPIPVDELFDLAFGDNPFTRAYHDSQKLLDYTIADWHKNSETGKRERQVNYKTVTQSIFGTNTITCNEKQMLEMEKAHSIYILNSEVFNEGMKYTDAFYVTTKFCMYQRDAKASFLRVTAEVRYVKSVNAIAKSFIEKNCHSNIEEGVNNLVRRLENHQKPALVAKKHRHKKKTEHKIESVVVPSPVVENPIVRHERTITGKGFAFDLVLFAGLFLLILHFYLCLKLYHIDQALSDPDHRCDIVCRKN